MKLGVRKLIKDFSDDEIIEAWGQIYPNDFTSIEGVEVTHNLEEADLSIIWNTIPPELMELKNHVWVPKNPEKIIIFIQESPVAGHRRMLHDNIDKFFLAITHNPNGPNQIPFTDKPFTYPWGPMLDMDIKREDTTIKNRNFFYAARKLDAYEKLPDIYNTHVLYGARVKLVEAFKKYPDRLKLYGACWGGFFPAISGKSTKTLYKGENKGDRTWRHHKMEDIEESKADFHIVLENCIQKNLITDHFHDGFSSDRVIFYLGCSNIEEHIPMDILIDLRPYYNAKTNEFDIEKIIEIADNMTQEEYDGYIHRAREWRKTLKFETGSHKFHHEAHLLSKAVSDKVKEYIKGVK